MMGDGSEQLRVIRYDRVLMQGVKPTLLSFSICPLDGVKDTCRRNLIRGTFLGRLPALLLSTIETMVMQEKTSEPREYSSGNTGL